MIIDGHAHACGKLLTAEGIIKILEKEGIDKVVLVPGEKNSKTEYFLPSIASIFPNKNMVKVTNRMTKFIIGLTGKVKYIPEGNELVYQLKQNTEGKVIQFVWITQSIKEPINYLDTKFKEWKFSGVKLHQCWENFSIDSEFFRKIAFWAEEREIPLFIHIFSDSEVSKLIEYKRFHPNLKLIIAHLFGIEILIKEDFKDENIFFDISTTQLVSKKRLMKALNFMGADKILLGTDSPYGVGNFRKNVDRVKMLDISDNDKRKILGENMRKLINLE